MNYYVYAYLRVDGTPYYIGKGTGKRAWTKGKGEVGKPKDKSRIVIVERNLTQVGSLAIERKLIRWYGRIDQKTGILRNKTYGGDGGKGGTLGAKLSDETKSKISNALKGKPHTEQTKHKIREALLGKHKNPFSKDHKQKISKALKGKAKSNDHINKISSALKGRTPSLEERVAYLTAMEKGKNTMRTLL